MWSRMIISLFPIKENLVFHTIKLYVPPNLNFQIPIDITFAIETPAPSHIICSIQTTNNPFIAAQQRAGQGRNQQDK